ncbi:hypothetical protein PMAYCL1PPCAC_26139 [Pristionchus mayeri]|uniref:ADP ribosylation factor n=1 Tax=Pristionchus mayeri TaxID=1317129 RepID=A0AAN5D5D6_9BILA|nr:hypothetical protein PMAYCL1PPCAC_26139 [Pristionchus mayeri]
MRPSTAPSRLMHMYFQIFHEVALGVQECICGIREHEKCVQTFMKQQPNYPSFPDNAHYYLPKLPALLAPDYKPTPEDILHLRIPTTAVNEINFSFALTKIRLIDVGGQRTYRKKWIHCFDSVSAVLFVASMAAYNQSLEQVDAVVKPVYYNNLLDVVHAEKAQNRLRESAYLFGEMLRSKFLTSSAFILFLNKVIRILL